MPTAHKMSQFIEKSSWIRKMFEEGAMLKAQYGQKMYMISAWAIPIWTARRVHKGTD